MAKFTPAGRTGSIVHGWYSGKVDETNASNMDTLTKILLVETFDGFSRSLAAKFKKGLNRSRTANSLNDTELSLEDLSPLLQHCCTMPLPDNLISCADINDTSRLEYSFDRNINPGNLSKYKKVSRTVSTDDKEFTKKELLPLDAPLNSKYQIALLGLAKFVHESGGKFSGTIIPFLLGFYSRSLEHGWSLFNSVTGKLPYLKLFA